MPMVTPSPHPNVILVKPPCTTSPGTPLPNSTTMATTPSPNRIKMSVPKNSAINSGSIKIVDQGERQKAKGGRQKEGGLRRFSYFCLLPFAFCLLPSLSVHAIFESFSYVVVSSSGTTRVSPMVLMKLASPDQRGTTCI